MEFIALSLSFMFFLCLVSFFYLRILYAQQQSHVGISGAFFVISLSMITAEFYPNMQVVYELYFGNRLGGAPVITLLKNLSYQMGLSLVIQIFVVLISFFLSKFVYYDDYNVKIQKVLLAGSLMLGLTYVIKGPMFDFAVTLIDTGMVSGFN